MLFALLRNTVQRVCFVPWRLTKPKRTCYVQNKQIYDMDDENHLVWVDLEGPDIIIKQPDSVLESMNEWCKEHHGKSGLTKAVQGSSISVQKAEEEVLRFVKAHCRKPGKCLLAGNSVHEDKAFLKNYMPKFIDHLHYRIIDVSTVKELCKYWYPEIYEKAPRKAGCHRALDDIRESLKELKFYRSRIFK